MIQFENILYSITEYADTKLDALNDIQREGQGAMFTFKDICKQIEYSVFDGDLKFKRCVTSPMPLDFVYEKKYDSYLLDSKYDTDEKLLEKIQTGKGDLSIYEGNRFIYIDGIFSETEPS